MGRSSFAESGQIAEQAAPVVSGTSPLPWKSISVSVFGEFEVLDAAGDEVAAIYASNGNAAFIVRAVNSHEALVKALSIFLGEDGRFQVAIGGNPIAIDAMLAEARAALASAREVQP